MLDWWIRPFVRLIAALSLPFAVPAVITIALWVLPGDPARMMLDKREDANRLEIIKHKYGFDRCFGSKPIETPIRFNFRSKVGLSIQLSIEFFKYKPFNFSFHFNILKSISFSLQLLKLT